MRIFVVCKNHNNELNGRDNNGVAQFKSAVFLVERKDGCQYAQDWLVSKWLTRPNAYCCSLI